jgi:general secretion pathway protein D
MMGGGMMGGGYGGGMMGGGMMGGGMMGGYGGMMGGMGNMMSAQQAQSLRQLIQESIEPESWFELNDLADGTVTPYPMQQPKKLAVYNTHEVHEEVEKLLTSLRKKLGHQVSIEARFLVVSESFLEDIGLDVDFSVNAGTHWGQITFEQDSATFTNPEPTSVPLSVGGLGASASLEGGYGTILDDLQVSFLLRATQAHRDARSMQANIASVLSGESASFNVSRSFYFALPPVQQAGATQLGGATGTTTNIGQGTTPQYQPVTAMNNLFITPIITHDKKNVLLNIETSKMEFLGVRTTTVEVPIVGGVQGAEVFEYDVQTPEQEQSSLTTRVSVPDKGTLLLGGQRITERVETEAGVPILSKLPLVGRLFRNRSKVDDSKILLILVKPVIILQEEREAEAIAAMEGEL